MARNWFSASPAELASNAAASTRLDSLTGLRFFAAWLVVQHHFTNFGQLPFLWRYTGFGTTGVTFFFVLSGFVLTWSFRRDDTPPRFYWRRFARIWPLHVVTTLLAIPVFYTWRDVPYEWTGIVLSIFLLHAWVPAATTYFAGNPASWSLSCEMFFYAIHPLIVRRVLAAGLAMLAGATVAICVILYVVADLAIDWPARLSGWLLYIAPPFRIGEFFLGVLLAAAVKRGFRSPLGIIPATILVAAWFELYDQASPKYLSVPLQIAVGNLNYVVLPLLYAAIILAAAQHDLRGQVSLLQHRFAVLLGQWSYALYLVHATIIYAFIEVFGPRPTVYSNLLWLALVTVVATAVAALLYYAVEHPAETWLRAVQRRRIAAVAKPAVAAAESSPAG